MLSSEEDNHMNNIQDNPARVAPPEPPLEPDYKKLRFEFLNNYLESDNIDSDFHVKIEAKFDLIENYLDSDD